MAYDPDKFFYEQGTPRFYLSPSWDKNQKSIFGRDLDFDGGDWQYYIGDELRAIWDTLTAEQKRVIARNAQALADDYDPYAGWPAEEV